MLKICLSRVGKKKQPSYRIIVLEKRKDPWGDFLEIVGRYDPLARPKIIEFKKDRIQYWMSVGAQLSPTVHNLLVDAGAVAGGKRKASRSKKAASEVAEEKAQVEGVAKTDAPAQ